MRAVLRLEIVFAAAGLLLAPAVAHAQETSAQPATTNSPAPDSIGPRELQNFSLPDAPSKPTDEPSTPTATPAPAAPADPAAAEPSAPALVHKTVESRTAAARTPAPPPAAHAVTAPITAGSPPTVAIAAPSVPQPSASAAASPVPPAAPAETLGPERRLSILPWILAALLLAGGILFLLWRRRPRHALVAGPEFNLFVPSEPRPAPTPAQRAPARESAPSPPPPRPEPQPAGAPTPKRPASATNGIVASRLRPSLEIGMQPLRCVVDDNQVAIEFEVELFNAGTAPARAVIAEASLLNASAAQDQELAAFFAKPVGAGERIESIAPMKRIALTSRVVAPRAAIHEYEMAGRKAFVPVIAFNALYEGSGGKAQSSVAYLVGRETKSEKLGPLRLDTGPSEVRSLGARPLPLGVKT